MSPSDRPVFLSYASQDADAARRICDALRQVGVEVWFDQSELRGGDAWDGKIRRQIKECTLFMPVISANTQARPEGYFRLEWKLAVDRSHLMADDAPFLFPVVIDNTPDATARVPDRFRDVQWTRLRLDETPVELATRVAGLLAGESAAVPRPTVGPAYGREHPRRRALHPMWRFILIPIAGLLLAGGGMIIKRYKDAAERSPAEAKAARPVSEARQLTEKARALLETFDTGADDYAVAEGYIKRALELDSNDGEIYAVSSLLNTAFRTRGFDQSPSRDAVARSHAERALRLAPDSVEALYALARWQRDNDPDQTVAERTFRQVLARNPDHAGALLGMAMNYARMGKFDEALALLQQAARNPASSALARYQEFLICFRRAKFQEAEQAVRQSIAVQPSANSQAGLAMVLLTWKGDAEGAARAVASGPASFRNEHRILWISALVHLARQAPEEALKAMDRLSDDFIRDNWFVGPKAYWVGMAHWVANRPEAARVAWEAGLGVVETHLKATPDKQDLHLILGELLAWLGREQEALRELKTVNELSRRADLSWYVSPVRIYAALGRVDEALPILQYQLSRGDADVGWPLTPALLRRDPLWGKLRGDPRFQKLVAEVEAEKDAGTTPRP